MKKVKIKWKNIVILLLFIISVICLVVSGINIIKWKNDGNKIDEIVENIEEITEIEEVPDNKETIEIIETEEEIPKSNPYWDYIKMNLINVDFKELRKINPATVGWIQVNGTNINYPFVQTSDNKFYLKHSFDQSYNSAGWVFLDYRNSLTVDKNTIIYAYLPCA